MNIVDKKILLENTLVSGTAKKTYWNGYEGCTFHPELNIKSLKLAKKRRLEEKENNCLVGLESKHTKNSRIYARSVQPELYGPGTMSSVNKTDG